MTTVHLKFLLEQLGSSSLSSSQSPVPSHILVLGMHLLSPHENIFLEQMAPIYA